MSENINVRVIRAIKLLRDLHSTHSLLKCPWEYFLLEFTPFKSHPSHNGPIVPSKEKF